MEPRLMLAADAAWGASLPVAAPDDMVMHLPGSISGSVFVATHVKESRQAGDSGISGVRVELLSAAGEVLAEALTDEAGEYDFPALAPGTYAVRQIQPAGWLEGYELAGVGGGSLQAPHVIAQIVVHPGAMLTGYDFAEFATSVQPAGRFSETPSLIGFLPPLIVSWSRPAELIAPPSSEPLAPRPLQLPPPEPRPAEPIFGGSSRVLEEQDAAFEAFTDDEGEERVASRRSRTSSEATGELMDRHGKRLAVRDLAFESEEVAAQDEDVDRPPTEEDVTQSADPVVARRPAAPSEAAKKPAA